VSVDVKFGTSGLRGLVVAMTPELIAAHVRAFLSSCETGPALYVGRDLRPSSPRIAGDVIAAAQAAGLDTVDCGAVPTPALALAAGQAGATAVMVTGSHIPADRNGLKFYTPSGEITKADEAAILVARDGAPAAGDTTAGTARTDPHAGAQFAERYRAAFGAQALAGWRIGLYAHSSVGRDLLAQILTGLGAAVVELGRSEHFIPVDTEAVDPATRAQIVDWVRDHRLDALVSMDGDADRPLLADETGAIVPGDVMGQITAEALGATTVVTPVSSNSGVTMKGFDQVVRTRIGSPFVIAGMEAAAGAVVGYEANGGFLLGFTAAGPAGPLEPLMTRDCMLPLVMTLYASAGTGLAARVAAEPPVVTLADRLQEIPQALSGPFVAKLAEDAGARAAFLDALGQCETGLDLTDGVRMLLAKDAVVHVRPSGNAPELRLYVEAHNAASAARLMREAMAQLRAGIGAG
jgi:phosphomannomutase